MKKRVLIIGILFLSILSYSNNSVSYSTEVIQQVDQEKDQKSKYEERKDWIKERKNGLFTLCNELINMSDFPNTNIEAERDKLKLKVRMYIKEIKSVDYADDKKFTGIQKKFDNLESHFRDYTVKLRERENLKGRF